MEILKAIEQRHSIRSFQEKKVPKEVLIKLADAAQRAPSASNLQAWKFLFVTEDALREKVDFFSPGLSGKPPVILVICSDMEKALKKGGENSKIYGCMMDASMAAENIMLRAAELGLGTCAVKSYNEAAVRKLLKLPHHYRMELLISIGYPQGAPRQRRLRPMEEMLHYNTD